MNFLSEFELHDLVTRSSKSRMRYDLSENLSKQAFYLAHDEIETFLSCRLGLQTLSASNPVEAYGRFTSSLHEANRQILVGRGGVPERNFLSLWLIADRLRPELYVESGIFKGSSLFAIASTGNVNRIVGFDPVPGAWRANLDTYDVAIERHSHDFSDHQFDETHASALLYFDDHINTARRILEAKEKGFKHLIFDDSCGLMGSSERMWPSLPSLFFIMNFDKFRVGDFLAWPKETFREITLFGGWLTLRMRQKSVQNEFQVTREVVDLCSAARAAVSKCQKIPDLSDYIVTRRSIDANDITQHFVILN